MLLISIRNQVELSRFFETFLIFEQAKKKRTQFGYQKGVTKNKTA